MKHKPAAYVPDKGLNASTADGTYKLKIGGYAQLIYRYTDFDSQSSDDKSDFDCEPQCHLAGGSFAAEYYDLNADPDQGGDLDAAGYYVQAGYQVLPKTLELAVRYSEIESADANTTVPFDRSETQFGVNYYFKKHAAKLQADYTMVEADLNADKDDDIIRLQAQIY